ncbi:hypothetical protein ACFSRY_14225 [Pontibacter locisalis]|uniref:Lipoprotein n=1 Tax=Pontibacter locisalis TaxID=1719035 RepID=A0ABW5IPV7_9BACT
MKDNLKILCTFLLLLAGSCTPKNEEVKDEQVEIGPPAEALDSIADTKKDAVKTDENEISPTMPLPPPVLRLLSERYPGFKQPELSEEARELAIQHDQGPFIVRGDLNADNNQDYALQLQQGKSVIIVALTDAGNGNWNVYELQRDILFNDRGKLKSLYYLYLTEAGEEFINSETNEEFEIAQDAVSVGMEGEAVTYVYTNGKFTQYTPVEK